MFFKNLTAFRVDSEWAVQVPPLAPLLAARQLPEIPASAIECRGWHPTVLGVGSIEQFTLLRDFRALPGAAVRREANARIAELEQRQGFAVSRKGRRKISEEVAARLTPRVPVQRGELQALLDRNSGWLLVNTASAARSDELTRTLRETLGSLPAVPLASGSLSALMTRWLAAGAPPAPFAFDDECQLVSRDETKASVRFKRHNLEDGNVVAQLREGKLATSIALIWQEQISFVLDDRLAIRRLQFLDAALVASTREEHEADQAEIADLTLMGGMFRNFLADLVEATGAAK